MKETQRNSWDAFAQPYQRSGSVSSILTFKARCLLNSFHIFYPKTNEKIPTTDTLKLTTKKRYDILIQKSDYNTVKRYQKFHSPTPWKQIWKTTYGNFYENKYCDLPWRVLHRALPLAPALHKRARDCSPACDLCDCDAHETLTHLFCECPTVKLLIRQTEFLMSNIQGKQIKLTLDNLIFNLIHHKLKHSNPLCNYLINVTRYCIWYSCNVIKFDHKDIDMPTLFRIIVKERLQAEFFIYKHMKKNIHDFNILWACNNALRIVNDSSLVQLF